MDNTDYGSAMNEAALRDKANAQEKRIRALELQVQTLTQAVQHIMIVTEPLLKLAQEAHAQQSRILVP